MAEKKDDQQIVEGVKPVLPVEGEVGSQATADITPTVPVVHEVVVPEALRIAASDFITELTKAREEEQPQIDATKVLAFPIAIQRHLLESLKGTSYQYGAMTHPIEEYIADFEAVAAITMEYAQKRNQEPSEAQKHISGALSNNDRRREDAYNLHRVLLDTEPHLRPYRTEPYRLEVGTLARYEGPVRFDPIEVELGERTKEGSERPVVSFRTIIKWTGSHSHVPPTEGFVRAIEEIQSLNQSILPSAVVEFEDRSSPL